MLKKNVNYIHNGKPFNSLIEALTFNENKIVLKKELLSHLSAKQLDNKFFTDVVKSFKGNKSKKICLSEFCTDILNSKNCAIEFNKLGCRGFSYEVHDDIKLGGDKLLSDVNFRIALMPSENHYYPYRVRRYLRKILINHYKNNGYPSICFSIGKLTSKECVICVIQSDIIFGTPAFIREHFRGWRKVLMSIIIESLKTKCNYINLPSSRDIIKCSHPFQKPLRVPRIWKTIYDQTANDFGFSFVKGLPPVNIQIYENFPPLEVTEMYKLKIS